MKRPDLSICIPTYNREKFLRECLDSIVGQFEDASIEMSVEIIVVDNNSADNTKLLVNSYSKKWKNISYFRNKVNIGPIRNIVEARRLAKGKYIWVFSDDDVIYNNSLKLILERIRIVKANVFYVNLDAYSVNLDLPVKLNILGIKEHVSLKGKKEFFEFISKYFPDIFSIDWYTTFLSNLIIDRTVCDVDHEGREQYFNSDLGYYPHFYEILHTPRDYTFYVISDRCIKYRSNNASYLGSSIIHNYQFLFKLTETHYKTLIDSNHLYIGRFFIMFIKLKLVFMRIRLFQLRVFAQKLKKTSFKNLMK